MVNFDDESDSLISQPDEKNKDQAADLIRQKVERVYSVEPSAALEEDEIISAEHLSKHQKYMHSLMNSGADLATIQTKWHKYYIALPENEKLQVWQEFYDSQEKITKTHHINHVQTHQNLAKHKSEVNKKYPRRTKLIKSSSTALSDKLTAKGKLKAKHHLQSLLFGLGTGLIVVFIFLFGFFNEVIIAPFIQPSRVNASTPLILDTNGIAPTPNPEVIIPKINVQIPVIYSINTTDENVIENSLEDGVVHYPTTVLPGQLGNAAFFGHSSNNIFNPGKYKFAFVLLHNLQNNDTFYLTNNNKVYVYQVISKSIVNPGDVGVLGNVAGQSATATLITCDPPGTSLHRLVVVGKQISPDPSTNSPSSINSVAPAAKKLPGNGQTFFGRVFASTIGKLILISLIVLFVYFGYTKIFKLTL